MIRVVVLASGSGTTLQALLDAFPARVPDGDIGLASGASGAALGTASIVAVICNTPGALALERARRARVPAILVDHRGRSRDEFEAELAAALEAYHPDLICLAGFLRILSPEFVGRYRGRILNTHPALLPAFGGKGMYGERVHRAVLEAGMTVTGCTVHVVDEDPDGGPIVAQASVPVLPGDTPASLAERVKSEERRLYPDVVRWWARGQIALSGRTVAWNGAAGGGKLVEGS
jgi:phosphoribosylglycinamide formyltransferase-1